MKDEISKEEAKEIAKNLMFPGDGDVEVTTLNNKQYVIVKRDGPKDDKYELLYKDSDSYFPDGVYPATKFQEAIPMAGFVKEGEQLPRIESNPSVWIKE
ncbi:hypothetical protein ACFSQ3_13125 [Sphingobacterium corticis]|uniref:Uncharacterized protein n=1 Tax=Sphingobacterium corticis TaxID=1812823 RepID=A0ABW5NMM2_9SPHI